VPAYFIIRSDYREGWWHLLPLVPSQLGSQPAPGAAREWVSAKEQRRRLRRWRFTHQIRHRPHLICPAAFSQQCAHPRSLGAFPVWVGLFCLPPTKVSFARAKNSARCAFNQHVCWGELRWVRGGDMQRATLLMPFCWGALRIFGETFAWRGAPHNVALWI
jgi:hypothetical protein